MNCKYKIAYLCIFDPMDKKTNSGVQWHMINALRKNGNEVYPYYPSGSLANLCIKVLYKIYRMIYENSSKFYNSIIFSLFLGLYFTVKLKLKKTDLVFVSRGSSIIPFLKTNIPIVYTSDATFELMLDYNRKFTNISESQRKQGKFIEQSAISRAKLCIYPSVWAANSAINDYGAAQNKVVVIPSGANFTAEIPSRQFLQQRLTSKICRILFVAKEWTAKGGEIAFNAVKNLNEKGIPAKLTVIGCIPPCSTKPEWLEIVPFLDKNKPQDSQLLADYFSQSHFFILPTRYETFGLVFAEACAYGLPILATDTGGVSTSIEDGVNGYLFDLNDIGEQYATKIASIWLDKELYRNFSDNSRIKYEKSLNWDVWGVSVQKNIERILN